MSLQPGDAAPDFSVPATGGRTVSLEGQRGKKFVLYFYPKADTPGCTKEACAFQEALPQLGHMGLEVIGVSKDKIEPIEKFAEKYELKFPLASDAGSHMAEEYGVWVEKSMYGKKYHGRGAHDILDRPHGRVARVWPKVKVEGHAQEVMQAAKNLP